MKWVTQKAIAEDIRKRQAQYIWPSATKIEIGWRFLFWGFLVLFLFFVFLLVLIENKNRIAFIFVFFHYSMVIYKTMPFLRWNVK